SRIVSLPADSTAEAAESFPPRKNDSGNAGDDLPILSLSKGAGRLRANTALRSERKRHASDGRIIGSLGHDGHVVSAHQEQGRVNFAACGLEGPFAGVQAGRA